MGSADQDMSLRAPPFQDESQEETISHEASPNQQMPAELIAQFLKWAVAFPPDHAQRPWFAQLRCVSKLWREVALSSPALWSGLSVDVQDNFTLHYIGQWLDRAYGLPLTFSITDTKPYESGYLHAENALTSLLSVLLEDRNWSSISLPTTTNIYTSGPYESLFKSARDSPIQPWRNLKEIALMCCSHYFLSPVPYRGESMWHLPFDACSPNLEDLKLKIHGTSVFLHRHHQIQTLSLFISYGKMSLVLDNIPRNLPALRQLTISFVDYPTVPTNSEPGTELVHNTIEDLELHKQDGLRFMRYLRLPNLKRLVLTCPRQNISPHTIMVWGSELAKFLTLSGCSLRYLDVHQLQMAYTEQEVSKILRAVPLHDLEYLSFRTRNFPMQMSHKFLTNEQVADPLLLPSITKIVVYGQRPSFSMEDLAVYFEKRHQRLSDPADHPPRTGSADISVVLQCPQNTQMSRAWHSQKHKNALARLAEINVHFSELDPYSIQAQKTDP